MHQIFPAVCLPWVVPEVPVVPVAPVAPVAVPEALPAGLPLSCLTRIGTT